MKIYPSKHRIKQIAESNIDKDISIPLAYLNNENVSYSITRKVHDDFTTTLKTPVLPNQELANESSLLFDEQGNPIESDKVINRVESRYYYRPNNMIEFTPLSFSYNVVAQRKLKYTISSNFNINITCLDDPQKQDFINRMSKILVAPSEKNYLPNNILINNNSTETSVLTNIDYENTNFVFIESEDGQHYNFETVDDYDDVITSSKNLISYETFLSSNINTWIISDDHYKYPMTNGTGYQISLKNPVITSEQTFFVKNYYNANDPALKNLKIHNLFENDICPILIIENENKGFTIYSSSEIFSEENIIKYKHIIYEVLMYVYCNSYKTSRYVNEYITYTMPDYEIKNNTLHRKNNFISRISLNNLLKINLGSYRICNINIVDNNKNLAVPSDGSSNAIDCIKYAGISNNKIVFKIDNSSKNNNIYKEPEKPTGWKSIYYNDKVYYLEKIHYLIETNIGKSNEDIENKLFLIEKDSDLLIKLYPFKSSKHGLNIERDLNLSIPFIKTTVNGNERIKNENYVVYYNTSTKKLEFVYELEYEDRIEYIYLFLISMSEQKSEQYLTDMRVKGGGLPEDMPDNFNLLDIGHIYGRPYRQSNTLIITLPKKYEPYKNEILDIINKYKVAEDYPILFFEDDETDGEI